jgi:squalene cyclase
LDYYATWLAIEGLLAVGVESHDGAIRQAADALAARQCEDGGFSASHVSEKNSTTLSTSWALLALMTARPRDARPMDNSVVDQAAAWLLDRQDVAGKWPVDGESVASTLDPLVVSETVGSIYALRALTRWAKTA